MKKTILILTSAVLLFSCQNESEENEKVNPNEIKEISSEINKEQFLKDFNELETKLKVEKPAKEDIEKAITMYQDYAGIFPDDKKSPDYLLQASDFAYTMNQYAKSVKILNRIIDNYPEYYNLESAYFNRASHTDFELRDTALARIYYNEFIDKFPESDFVKDAEVRLNTMHLSLDDLVKTFKNKPQ